MDVETLRLRIRTQPITVLLGAGASIDSGGRTANQIAINLARRLYGAGSEITLRTRFEKEHSKPLTFESILEELATGGAERKQYLIEEFRGMSPSIGYRYLAILLRQGVLAPLVLSTNFDQLLEDALASNTTPTARSAVRTITAAEVLSGDIAPTDNEILIVKLHGDISRPDTLRITARETTRFPKPVVDLITRLLNATGILVVGHSGVDLDLRDALLDSDHPVPGRIFWVTKDIPNRASQKDLFAGLEYHESANQILSGLKFDEFFTVIGKPYEQAAIRHRFEDKLTQVWSLLDTARSRRLQRKSILERAWHLISDILETETFTEVSALGALITFELKGGVDFVQQLRAVELLRSAISDYVETIPSTELAGLRLSLQRELLNLFLIGGPRHDSRLEYLQEAMTEANWLTSNLSDGSIFLQIRAKIMLGEVEKELAMITSDRNRQRELYLSARGHFDNAIITLKKETSDEAKLLLGTAYRHAAVTFEIEGDSVPDEGGDRKLLYEQWRQYSADAQEMLECVGEDLVRAYALINLASSCIRLVEFELNPTRQKALLSEAEDALDVALDLFTGLENNRGRAWTHIHLADLHRARIATLAEDQEKKLSAEKAADAATNAISELRLLDDSLAAGLAQLFLASAHYIQASFESEDVKRFRNLIDAEKAADEAAAQLRETGYLRSLAEACIVKARVLHARWQLNRSPQDLTTALTALLDGLTTAATALDLMDNLDRLYGILTKQFDEIAEM